MSGTGTSNWQAYVADTMQVVNALAPVIAAANPAIGAGIALGTKIIQGVVAEEPAAVALFNQIKSGTPPTPTQLQQFATDYEASYQKLNADIQVKLAATP